MEAEQGESSGQRLLMTKSVGGRFGRWEILAAECARRMRCCGEKFGVTTANELGNRSHQIVFVL